MYKAYIVLAAVLGLTLTACGTSYSEFCASAIQCEGGNDADVNACVAVANGAEDEAAAYDCSDAYFKHLECVEKTSTCSKTHFDANCKSERDALHSCENAASGRR